MDKRWLGDARPLRTRINRTRNFLNQTNQMKATVLNDHYVNSISKAIIIVPNGKQKTIELILTEDGRQDFRLSLDIQNAKELRDTLISHIADFVTPKTVKMPVING